MSKKSSDKWTDKARENARVRLYQIAALECRERPEFADRLATKIDTWASSEDEFRRGLANHLGSYGLDEERIDREIRLVMGEDS